MFLLQVCLGLVCLLCLDGNEGAGLLYKGLGDGEVVLYLVDVEVVVDVAAGVFAGGDVAIEAGNGGVGVLAGE